MKKRNKQDIIILIGKELIVLLFVYLEINDLWRGKLAWVTNDLIILSIICSLFYWTAIHFMLDAWTDKYPGEGIITYFVLFVILTLICSYVQNVGLKITCLRVVLPLIFPTIDAIAKYRFGMYGKRKRKKKMKYKTTS